MTATGWNELEPELCKENLGLSPQRALRTQRKPSEAGSALTSKSNGNKTWPNLRTLRVGLVSLLISFYAFAELLDSLLCISARIVVELECNVSHLSLQLEIAAPSLLAQLAVL
jgi:hypothetical protein